MRIEIIESHGGFFRAIGSRLSFLIVNYGRLKRIFRYTIINMINFIFSYLDNLINWNKDTLGYNIIAKKVLHERRKP